MRTPVPRHVPLNVKIRLHVPLREKNSIDVLFAKWMRVIGSMFMYKHDSCHVECVALLQRVSNTRERT